MADADKGRGIAANSAPCCFDLDAGVEMSEEAPMIRIAFAIIQKGVRDNANEIHIVPRHEDVQILESNAGVLEEMMTIPRHIVCQLTRRFKIMAEIDPFKPGIPQNGRFSIKVAGATYELAAAFTPDVYGEKIVICIAGEWCCESLRQYDILSIVDPQPKCW